MSRATKSDRDDQRQRSTIGGASGGAAALAVIWILNLVAPEAVAAAPTGAETILATLFASLGSWFSSPRRSWNDPASPLSVGMLAIALAIMLSGCQAIGGFKPETPRETVAAVSEGIEQAAIGIRNLNDQGVLSDEVRAKSKSVLEDALDLVQAAKDALAADNATKAERALDSARELLDAVESILRRHDDDWTGSNAARSGHGVGAAARSASRAGHPSAHRYGAVRA